MGKGAGGPARGSWEMEGMVRLKRGGERPVLSPLSRGSSSGSCSSSNSAFWLGSSTDSFSGVTVVGAAISSVSAANRQPWRFLRNRGVSPLNTCL